MSEREVERSGEAWGLERAAPMPSPAPRPNSADCRRAATRIHRLFRDLRRQREAWADFDFGGAIAAANPDVAAFNRERTGRPYSCESTVLVDLVAGMIGDELGGAKL